MAAFVPSLRSITKFALGGAQLLLAPARLVEGGSSPTCSNPQLSCQNTTVQSNTCCFNAPGGQFLQPQFWDTNPSTGPTNSWTIHGLWPDNCDGTFQSNCDSSRDYTNIAGILTSAGATSTLSYMQTYWKDINGNDETFWEHEWATHGTCISTLNPSCYTNYTPKQEAVDFFNRVVSLFQTLPTYQWLSDAGITPSSSKTYTSSQIQSAISAKFGHQVTLLCNSNTLNQIYYTFNVQGSVQSGTFVAVDPAGQSSTCPSSGIKYPPKSGSSSGGGTSIATGSGGTSTTTGAPPTGTGIFSGKGHLEVTSGGSQNGCIISAGTWYTTGTCATFTATTSGSGFTLTSSKGNCGVSSGALTCGSGVSATVFTASGGNLAYGGSTTFYASAVPSGTTQETVYTSSHSVSITISWQST